MKNLGRYLFWITWPAIWFYAPLVRRVRVFIVHDGEVLLVKNWFGPRVWQLPGGGIKLGESVSTAAKREIEEELGLVLSDTATVMNKEPVIVRQFGLIMRYHLVYWKLTAKPALRVSKEISEVAWMLENHEAVAPEVLEASKRVRMLY